MGFFKRTRNMKRESPPLAGYIIPRQQMTTEWWQNSYTLPHQDVNTPQAANVMQGERYEAGGFSGRSNGQIVTTYTQNSAGETIPVQYLVIGSVAN